MKKPFRRWFFIAGLNLAGAAVLLVAGEIVFRLRETYVVRQSEASVRRLVFVESDPEFLVSYTAGRKRLVPGAHVIIKHHRLSGRDIKMDINALGFRDREIPLEKRAGERRVLVLGDSITVADYLPAEETYAERAEFYLRGVWGPRVEVINAGIGDVGLTEELDLLEEWGLQLKPDVAVVGFFLNDSRPAWGFPGELGSYGFLRRRSVLAQKVYEQLVLWRWVEEKGEYRLRWPLLADRRAWRMDPRIFFQFVKLAEYDWGAAWREESWTTVERELRRLKTLSLKYGFQVVILFSRSNIRFMPPTWRTILSAG